MSLKRLATACSMTGREFLRRRGMLALMVAIPVMSFALVYLALPDTPASIDAIENGVQVRVDIDQVALFGGVSALIYGALLAGITGFYVMASAVKTDRRLILAGYLPVELVSARCIVLLLLDLGITALLVVIMLFFFMPKQLPLYVLAMFWGAMIYGFYGALLATLVKSELGGLLGIVFLSNIDVGYLQIPGYSNVIGEWWARLLPGYFPVQLAIDAAFTTRPELLLASFWSIPHSLVVAGIMLGTYTHATHIHSFLPEERNRVRWWAVALPILVIASAAGGLLVYREVQLRPASIDVEGRIDAPEFEVVSPSTGRLRSVDVLEAEDVAKDAIVAWVEDTTTGMVMPLLAPVRGRVTTLEGHTGEYVVQGDPIARIHQVDRMQAVLEVEETQIGEVAVGQPVDVTLAALGITLRSRVTEIASVPLPPDPSVSERTRKIRKYAVKCDLLDADPRLRIGVAVRGKIFTG